MHTMHLTGPDAYEILLARLKPAGRKRQAHSPRLTGLQKKGFRMCFSRRFARVCALIWLVTASLIDTPAQTVMGTILGTVNDSAGASIPQAQIIVENTGIGLQRTAMTSDLGQYTVPDLPVGTYKVSASKAGFKTEIRSGITLTIGATINVSLAMKVGDIA